MPKLFALVDCNNFFVSCERAFQPGLMNKPVLVLSSNDGCAISRSTEVKALGIPMGAPYFKYQAEIEKFNVKVFSSNFSLYGDISHRVMETIQSVVPEIEVYSIDEAFLDLSYYKDPKKLMQKLRQTISQWTRIPVSIGIGSTKVLAKAASALAKRDTNGCGVFMIDNQNLTQCLKDFPVGEVWGIGRSSAQLLWEKRINTASEFIALPNVWIKKHLSINGLRIANELRGEPCLSLESEPPPKKGITCSRSFGRAVTDLTTLKEAVANFVSRAAEKLRAEGLAASYICIFIRTSRFSAKKYAMSQGIVLPEATSYTPFLIQKAALLVEKIYQPGYHYAKAGVHCLGLVPDNHIQKNLFFPLEQKKNERLMRVVDKINRHFGSSTITYLGAGVQKPWAPRENRRSPRYTTSWKELPVVK